MKDIKFKLGKDICKNGNNTNVFYEINCNSLICLIHVPTGTRLDRIIKGYVNKWNTKGEDNALYPLKQNMINFKKVKKNFKTAKPMHLNSIIIISRLYYE